MLQFASIGFLVVWSKACSDAQFSSNGLLQFLMRSVVIASTNRPVDRHCMYAANACQYHVAGGKVQTSANGSEMQ